MNYFDNILLNELKREVFRILHKKYYDVVLGELKDMTQYLPNCFDTFSPVMNQQRYVYALTTFPEPTRENIIYIPRWYCLPESY